METAIDLSRLQECIAKIDQINARLDRLLEGPPAPIVRRAEAMRMTGCPSTGAFQRFKREFGIVAVNRGRFSRMEIENAIARRVYKNLQEKQNENKPAN